MVDHDPSQFASELSSKLATTSRHVCAFLGAGSSRACGLPDVWQLQARVLEALTGKDKDDIQKQLNGRTLEQALSRLRRIAALLGDEGADSLATVDGLSAARAKQLDLQVCRLIISNLKHDSASLGAAERFASWAGRAKYTLPLEIFTVNYDLLLEVALESRAVPYFDGFTGNYRARFQTDLVEALPPADQESVPAFFVRLWKLHGSINWAWHGDAEIVRLGHAAEDLPAAIYPSDTKYDESRRVPFVVLQDRFRRALHYPETLCLVSGYSFGDAHINEILFKAASRRQRSEIVVFCFGGIPKVLADNAIDVPNIQVVSPEEAIVGGQRGTWKAVGDAVAGAWKDGKCLLGDFNHLSSFLARSESRAASSSEVVTRKSGTYE